MSLLPERTSWSRVLGTELREARVRAGFTNATLSDKLGWSPAKVSRMETVIRSGSTLDLISFATACGVFGKELKRLMELGARPWDGYWVQANGEPMPDELRSLILLETTAKVFDNYQPQIIPGLTQTEAYIRSLFHEAGQVAVERMEPRVRARLKRQQLLHAWECPQFTFYIHEHALRTPVGGPQVMCEQLRHLVDLSTRGVCRIRVVLASAGARVSSLAGAFTRLDHEDSATVNVELLTVSLFLDAPSDVSAYEAALAALSASALSERQSLGVLTTLANLYAQQAVGRRKRAGASA